MSQEVKHTWPDVKKTARYKCPMTRETIRWSSRSPLRLITHRYFRFRNYPSMIIVAEGVLRGIVLFPSRYYDYILIGISRNTHEILPVLKKDIKPGYAMPPILLQGVPQKHSTAPGSGQEVHRPVYLPPVSHQE
jgi:hypothetical protein